MGSEFIELDVPPHIRAIFVEWAKDWEAVPAPVKQAMLDSGSSGPAELAVFYQLLAGPTQHKMLSHECLAGLYSQSLSNRQGPVATGLPAEAAKVLEWLEPIVRAAFPNVQSPSR